jgi:hypothetical protein
MGRSSDPGRDRRRSGTGEAAVTPLSLGLGSGASFSRENDGLGLAAGGVGRDQRVHIGLAGRSVGTVVIEIGGFRVPNLRETCVR